MIHNLDSLQVLPFRRARVELVPRAVLTSLSLSDCDQTGQ
jgi:hypothetical protein